MKRLLALLCCMIIPSINLCLCKDNCFSCCDDEQDRQWAITLKNGYFYPQECVLRNIFDRCGGKGGYWVEGTVRYNTWKDLDLELSGSYFKLKGMAIGGTERTEIKIPTFGVGLKYFLQCKNSINLKYKCYRNYGIDCWNYFFERLSFFIGGGLRVFFYQERNCSRFVNPRYNKNSIGGMLNTGFEFDISNGFFIDLFADYNFKKLDADCSNCYASCCYDIQIGGLVCGLGVGYKF